MGGALAFQQLTGWIPVAPGNGQKEVLGRDKLILKPIRLFECLLKDIVERPSHMLLRKALHFGEPANLPLDFLV